MVCLIRNPDFRSLPKQTPDFDGLLYPLSPRTTRAASDRGRYPEEADTEEPYREDTPSDDEDDGSQFAYTPSEPISIIKPVTPAHSVNGDDISESPGAAMDIDFVSFTHVSTLLH